MPQDLSRRRFVVASGAVALGGAFPPTSVAARARREPFARGGTFDSGVASGEPGTRAMTLWSRLHGIESPRRLRFEVAADPEFRRVVDRGVVRAAPVRDFTVRPRVVSSRLRAGERYWYRFLTRSGSSPVGRFQTARPLDSREPVRIGWFSCQRYEHGFFTAQQALADDDSLDLVLSLGDYLYEEDSSPKIRRDGTGEPNGHAERLEQWRAKHRLYRSDPGLQAMHQKHAFLGVWDDCEVEGNWAGTQPSSGPSPVDERSISFAAKRANGFTSFFENMPFRPVGGERSRIFRKLRLGSVAELFLLDTRQYRDPQPCADASLRACPTAESDPRRRLGATQEAWLEDGLTRSGATWKLLGNAQMMMALDLPPGQAVGVDSWDGYGVERRRVLERLADRGVRDVVSLVGDVHTFFAGELRTDGRSSGRPLGTEFVGTSVSHDGIETSFGPGVGATIADQLVLANPHLRYARFGVRGYAVLEARPDELRVEFRGVRSVAQPRSEAYTLKRFRVAAGRPAVLDG